MGGIVKSVKKLVTGVVGGVTSLLGMEKPKLPDDPEAPVVEPVTPMPLPDDAARKAAKRRSIATQQARRGRASTILTTNIDDTGLGG